MDMLPSLERVGYYYTISRLTKSGEPYDKRKSVITGRELFELCYGRYKRLKEILIPLKEKLGESVEIINIGFGSSMQDEASIFIEYLEDDKKKCIFITKPDLNFAEVSFPEDEKDQRYLIKSCKRIIDGIFQQVRNEPLGSEYSIPSASRKFVIDDNTRSMRIRYSKGNIMSLGIDYAFYEKSGSLYVPQESISITRRDRLFQDESNVSKVYDHLRIYEADVPPVLKKELNYH